MASHLTGEETKAHRSWVIKSNTGISTKVQVHVRESFLEELAFEWNKQEARQDERQTGAWMMVGVGVRSCCELQIETLRCIFQHHQAINSISKLSTWR